MPLVPDLNSSVRQPAPPVADMPEGVSFVVEDKAGDDTPEIGENGRVMRILHGDGSITISTDGSALDGDDRKKRLKWFDNLVDEVEKDELGRIAEDLVRGIEEDQESRQEWLEERAQGLRLLALKIELPGIQGAADGAPVEGMSKVRHPLLQEAVLRFQANARSELLPTDGPVKIRNDNNNADVQEDQIANALEQDLNHFLTVTASEYYPDTDRMLLMLGFGGTAFKKVYFCPIRNRPVSETVDAEDLIVNNSATDLRNAKRVTHRAMMGQNVVRRLQIMGVYRDVDLSTPMLPKFDEAQQEKKTQQGLKGNSMRTEDRDREIYECYCELDIKGFAHKYKGKESGLEIPYRVTIDVSSKQILSITRNYDEDEKELPIAKVNFAKYTFVPGLGFYDIGLLHILGNTTNALTAAWRELLDQGMYACFPGFLVSDIGARQNTNIFRIAPGGGAQIKTGGMPIGDFVMPLPYNAQAAPALMTLVEEMSQTGMRVGGTSEQQVGEGRADAPVGTTLAMIDQATKVLNSVHKRMHAAQAEEFRLLVECFKEHPEAFWQKNKKPAYKWDEDTFLQALDDYELTPQADPNTASHGQRVMKIAALKQLQAANPSLYDPIAIDTAAMQAMGWSNPQQFFAPPSAQAAPPPELQKMQQEGQARLQEAQAKTTMAEAHAAMVKVKAMESAAKMKVDANKAPEGPQPLDEIKARTAYMDAQTRAKLAAVKHGDTLLNDANQQEDRASREKIELLEMAKELALHPQEAPVAGAAVAGIEGNNAKRQAPGLGGAEGEAEKDQTGAKKPENPQKKAKETRVTTEFHVPEAKKRKARGLGGAVTAPDMPPPPPPLPENEITKAVRSFEGTINKLSDKLQDVERLVNKLEEEEHTEKEIVRDERGRIVKVRKVRRPKNDPEI